MARDAELRKCVCRTGSLGVISRDPPTFCIAKKAKHSGQHSMSQRIAAAGGSSVAAHDGGEAVAKTSFWALTLGSIGVVYGDIGTSPLYALREAVLAATGPAGIVTPQAVLGVVSLILWALIIV